MAKHKRIAIIVALMMILAGSVAYLGADDLVRDKDWPDVIPGERYDTR